ncbi:MAG: FAD-binding protein [Aquificae bacterium]|nr:FAD-binding protein [Aquificota bacterium]
MNYFLRFDTSLLPQREAQVLVVGSGIAGLSLALYLSELGIRPVVLTKGVPNTYFSQGGIAAPVLPGDSPRLHFCDTLRAGRQLNDEQNTQILTNDALSRIADLERWGVEFDKRDGVYETTLEGGHSFPRVLKVKDKTGEEIHKKLLLRAKERGIPIVEGELHEIITKEGRVVGALARINLSPTVVKTRALVLATGGASSLYLHSTNRAQVGDAIGSAMRAGARVRNAEFVQFHPTLLKGTDFLLSEALRGEGAVLVDERGERFVDELLPRDLVARAIYGLMKEGKEVFLDLSPVERKGISLEERFPTISAELKRAGIDPSRVPVSPGAHYYIGGVDTDGWGRTTVEGLYAVGECACTGVHGANRLASNSLLEGIVFAHRTAMRLYFDLKFLKEPSRVVVKQTEEGNKKPRKGLINELKRLMWEYVGLERDEEGLSFAVRKLREWLKEAKSWERTPENRRLYDALLVALVTALSAQRRRESRGVHFRRDFPLEREVFLKDTLINPEEIL